MPLVFQIIRPLYTIMCVLQHVFLYVGIPTSGPYISDWIENAYKRPNISFCDFQLL